MAGPGRAQRPLTGPVLGFPGIWVREVLISRAFSPLLRSSRLAPIGSSCGREEEGETAPGPGVHLLPTMGSQA